MQKYSLHFRLENGSYKSLESPLIWWDIPMFAIIAGENGAGKTQLLELMYDARRHADQIAQERIDFSSSKTPNPGQPYTSFQEKLYVKAKRNEKPFAWLDGEILSRQVAFVDSGFGVKGANVAGLVSVSGQKVQIARQLIQQGQNDQKKRPIRAHEAVSLILCLHQDLKKGHGDDYWKAGEVDVAELIPDHALAKDDVSPVSAVEELAGVFLSYKVRRQQLIVSNYDKQHLMSPSEIVNALGPDPWQLANDLLMVAGYQYRLVSPHSSSLESYELRAEDVARQIKLGFEHLSSGEKTILGIVLCIFRAEHLRQIPKLLLIDEPDAHLHSNQIWQLLESLRRVLVERHGCRVVITTHRPETIAWSPSGALFRMTRQTKITDWEAARLYPNSQVSMGFESISINERIFQVDDPAQLITRLTGNMLLISRHRRLVLVEDQFDQDFWSTIYGLLLTHHDFPTSPLLVFQGTNPESKPGSGGCTAVKAVLKHLKDPQIKTLLCGLVDRDATGSHEVQEGLFLTSRYSIENYLFDPLLVYAHLGEQSKLQKFNLRGDYNPGDEQTLWVKSQDDLQSIADSVTKQVESSFPSLPVEFPGTFDVKFVGRSDLQIRYPNWLKDSLGHSNGTLPGLTHYFSETFDHGSNPKALLKQLKRWRALPVDLRDLLIQTTSY